MTPNPHHPTDPTSAAWRAPVGRVAGAVLGATLAGGAIAGGVAWAASPADLDAVGAGTVAAFVGAMLGLVPIVLTMTRTPFALALTQVIGSSVRLLVGAGIAVGAMLATSVDPIWTLATLLLAMLASLGAELAIVFPLLSRSAHHTEHTPAPEPA